MRSSLDCSVEALRSTDENTFKRCRFFVFRIPPKISN